MRRVWLSLGTIGLSILASGCGNSEKGKNKGKDVPAHPVVEIHQIAPDKK